MIPLRSPVRDRSYARCSHFPIRFCHPGYPKFNTLITLWATDRDTNGDSGLYARFALDVCAIVAANRHDGWLSTYPDIENARDNRVDANSTLRDRMYYYHLEPLQDDGVDEPYKIVPSFREWEFPHYKMPPHWQAMAADRTAPSSGRSRSNLSDALKTQDRSCRMSRRKENLQIAHIIPGAEWEWFERNNMSVYNSNQFIVGMDDIANATLLRADLHLAFDEPKFTFVPKGDGNNVQLVTHLIDTSEELVDLYHNRPLPPSSVSIEMLYARLAWTIFPFLGSFLQAPVMRRLALVMATEGVDNGGYVTPSGCRLLANYTLSRTRSQSPKKRSKPLHQKSPDEIKRSEAVASGDRCIARGRKRVFADDGADIVDSTHPHSVEPSLMDDSHSSSDDASSPFSSRKRIKGMQSKWLASERLRSDQTGSFAMKSSFAQEVWAGKAISSKEVPLFLEACGLDVHDFPDEGI